MTSKPMAPSTFMRFSFCCPGSRWWWRRSDWLLLLLPALPLRFVPFLLYPSRLAGPEEREEKEETKEKGISTDGARGERRESGRFSCDCK